MLIVDDEEEVHNITKSVLRKFEFEDKKLELLSAYSGEQAIEMLKEHPDTAIVLLDVVMESDDAGLVTVRRIREELKNRFVRIILRTGQPGSAPEKEVITHYDINDYKEKTELTATKLYTTVISAMRSYRDLSIIERNRMGLRKIITASKSIFKLNSLILFAEGVLAQLVSILNISDAMTPIDASDAFFATLKDDKFEVLASAGKFKDGDKNTIITTKALEYLSRSYHKKESFFEDDVFIGFYESKEDNYIFLYVEGCGKLDDNDKEFLNLFSNNISIAFDNVCLNEEVINTQKEIAERLGGVIENRSKDAAEHVHRVAEISYVLAKGYGLDEREAMNLKLASPMHDIGKIAIPDSVLFKPGKLDNDEFEIMKKHSEVGKEILANSKRDILKVAEIIAHEHHERYDGKGYPLGKKGEDIHIYGRITAVADVFDALSHKRIYKDAWSLDEVLDYFSEQRGGHFDPKIVDILFENIEQIKEILANRKPLE